MDITKYTDNKHTHRHTLICTDWVSCFMNICPLYIKAVAFTILTLIGTLLMHQLTCGSQVPLVEWINQPVHVFYCDQRVFESTLRVQSWGSEHEERKRVRRRKSSNAHSTHFSGTNKSVTCNFHFYSLPDACQRCKKRRRRKKEKKVKEKEKEKIASQ